MSQPTRIQRRLPRALVVTACASVVIWIGKPIVMWIAAEDSAFEVMARYLEGCPECGPAPEPHRDRHGTPDMKRFFREREAWESCMDVHAPHIPRPRK